MQNEYKQMRYEGITKEEIIEHLLSKYGKKLQKADISTVVEDISFDETSKLLDKMKEKDIEGEVL